MLQQLIAEQEQHDYLVFLQALWDICFAFFTMNRNPTIHFMEHFQVLSIDVLYHEFVSAISGCEERNIDLMSLTKGEPLMIVANQLIFQWCCNNNCMLCKSVFQCTLWWIKLIWIVGIVDFGLNFFIFIDSFSSRSSIIEIAYMLLKHVRKFDYTFHQRSYSHI